MPDARASSPPKAQLRLRLRFGPEAMLGPGRTELMERIDATGSISAAGRAMGMSYRRAWMLVEALNATFATPLIETTRGGSGGGGARLTETGTRVLHHYRQIEAATLAAGAADIAAICRLMKPQAPVDMSERK